jgi:hypothetical protein
MLSKHQALADEYRAKAQAEQDRADACPLPQARERHETAAAAWTELADAEERRMTSLARRFDRLAASGDPAATSRTPP